MIYSIKVVCDEPSHAGKVATVCQFKRVWQLPPGVDYASADFDPETVELVSAWSMKSRVVPQGNRRTKPLTAYDSGRSGARTVKLTADGRVATMRGAQVDHEKRALQCPLCLAMGHKDGPNVQGREERLQRVLDTLAAENPSAPNGVLRVSLSDLAARVSEELHYGE